VTDQGVALSLHAIRFLPDQAVVKPEERSRLQAVAKALSKVPDRSFLVVGHTARAGTVEGQERLSVERARAIVDYLVESGLEAARFLYEGRGARDPIAPNSTEEGRALNRRVEIIILED
jgi:outer membrane protein OmpA-like peptidoglycan-associated protein